MKKSFHTPSFRCGNLNLLIPSSLYLCFLCLSRVDVPMGGVTQVYTSLDEMEEKEEFKFSYANVRKATYTGVDCKFLIFRSI